MAGVISYTHKPGFSRVAILHEERKIKKEDLPVTFFTKRGRAAEGYQRL